MICYIYIMKIKERKGQNTIEYLLLLTIVIIVLAWLLKPHGILWNDLNQALDISLNTFLNVAKEANFGL